MLFRIWISSWVSPWKSSIDSARWSEEFDVNLFALIWSFVIGIVIAGRLSLPLTLRDCESLFWVLADLLLGVYVSSIVIPTNRSFWSLFCSELYSVWVFGRPELCSLEFVGVFWVATPKLEAILRNEVSIWMTASGPYLSSFACLFAARIIIAFIGIGAFWTILLFWSVTALFSNAKIYSAPVSS